MIEQTVSSPMCAQDILDQLTDFGRYDPHAVLGIQTSDSGQRVVRVYRPGAKRLYIELFGYVVEMSCVHKAGLFEVPVVDHITSKDYRIYHTNGLLAHDPYAFWPTFGEIDAYLLGQGTHYELYRKLGAQVVQCQDVWGVSFAVWAPSARQVSLAGDINWWDGRVLPMRSMGECGVWELFVPGLDVGAAYKFEIEGADGRRRVKTDPMGKQFEVRPKTAALVVDPEKYLWHDHEWMSGRREKDLNRPISIYELHLGSWKRKDGGFCNYRELGFLLAEYCVDMGFTHVELLPVAEHPLDESWGYQVTGYFAPTSRYGSFQDFQMFVDILHQHNIGVIIDWVPGHFPTDDFALSRFDGTALYEHDDSRQGLHPHWNTHIFNFGRHEVSNFLLSSALFWLDILHIDGLRVDAVASMLYLDYGRSDGEWIPNRWGGKENLEAIEFLRHANSIIHDRFPGVLTIAEESTAFPGISHSLHQSGLGFDMKWNMGWMNDTLRYFSKDPLFRHYHHNDLTFGLLYAFSERFALVFSHDEVVHGKKSLLSKMPGDIWQKFANLRLLYSYMICQPGKKLLFMGGEIATWDEWWEGGEMQWFLLSYPYHQGIQNCVRDLNHLYQKSEALYSDDFSFNGFEWVDFHDAKNSVISYLRKGKGRALFCIHNFTPTFFEKYCVPLKSVKSLREVFNTDATDYGGSGKVNGQVRISQNSVELSLPPLATVMFEIEF